jgi:hypothetical protein
MISGKAYPRKNRVAICRLSTFVARKFETPNHQEKERAMPIGGHDISGRPPRPPLVTVNVAEVIALRAIVMAVVVEMANHFEKSGGGKAQNWINDVAAYCADGIAKAEISAGGDERAERIRVEALEQVNRILGGIHFPHQRGNAN